jgi:hypothetical protein
MEGEIRDSNEMEVLKLLEADIEGSCLSIRSTFKDLIILKESSASDMKVIWITNSIKNLCAASLHECEVLVTHSPQEANILIFLKV